MKKNAQYAVGLGALLLLVSSCYRDNKEDIYQNTTNTCNTTDVFYSSIIEPIMTASCAISGCHTGTPPAGSLDLSTYQGVKKSADEGTLVNRIN